MAFAKFQENRFRIDGKIAENHAILVNLTASISMLWFCSHYNCLIVPVRGSTVLNNFVKNHGDQRCFFQFEIIINALVTSFRFI